MTVVHTFAGYVRSQTEGITRNVQGLVDALARNGETVRLDASKTELATLNRLGAHAANARAGRRLVRQALADASVEVVHHHVNIAAMGVACRRGPTQRARVLLHIWNAVYETNSGRRRPPLANRWPHRLFNGRRMARWGVRGVETVVVSSRFQADQLRGLGFGGRIHLVPNGVDAVEFRPADEERQALARRMLDARGDPLYLYYGHLSAWKGTDVLVDAFAHVVRENPAARLLIAHTDYGRGDVLLRERLRRRGVAHAVQLRGLSHVPSLLAAADVIVIPPVAAVGTACHPNVLLESLAAGRAVVATRVGSIPEAVREGETALLAEPADDASLAQAMIRIGDEAALRARLGAKARQDVLARFDWDLIAGRMQAIYHPDRFPRTAMREPEQAQTEAPTEASA